MSVVDKNYHNIFKKFRNFTLLHGKQQRTTEQIHNVFFKFIYFIAGFFGRLLLLLPPNMTQYLFDYKINETIYIIIIRK